MYSLPLCSLFLLFSLILFSRKFQGLPNNLLHTTKTSQSIYYILLYIFDYIPKQRLLKGKDKKYKRLRRSITQSQILDQQRRPAFHCCPFLLPVQQQLQINVKRPKKSKVGRPVAIHYRENKRHAQTVFIKCVGLKARFKLGGLCFVEV